MEMYVYYSIIVFAIIILSLYGYIIWIKTFEHYSDIKKHKYEIILIPLIDSVVNDFTNQQSLYLAEKGALIRSLSKNKLKKLVLEGRIIYHLEILEGPVNAQLIHFCETTGLVTHELKQLSQKNLYAKALACKKLGALRSKISVPYLLKEIGSNSQDVIYNALLALAKIGDEQGFLEAFKSINTSVLLSQSSLIEIVDSFEGDKNFIYSQMIHHHNDFVSCIFIKSARSMNDVNIDLQIAPFLKKGYSKEKTIAAITSLSNTNNSTHLDDLSTLLTDENSEIRALSATALSCYDNLGVMDKLTAALSDEEWSVRHNAASSLLLLDKQLDCVAKVFENSDEFAKDSLILAMENNNILSPILDDTILSPDISQNTVLLIKNHITKGGDIKIG